MRGHVDPYDPVVAFDDLVTRYDLRHDLIGGCVGDDVFEDRYSAAPSIEELHRVAREIVHAARARHLGPPPFAIEGLGCDATRRTFSVFSPRQRTILGDDAPGLPLFAILCDRFSRAIPPPTAIRIDDRESYGAFCAARRDPYVRRLEERLTLIEDAFASHVADPDAHEDLVGCAIREAVSGGTEVPLPLPPRLRDKVRCWQDGSEILCTARVRGVDGRTRLATTALPISRGVDRAIEGARQVNADPDAAAVVLPEVAQVIGGEEVLHLLFVAVPRVIASGRTVCAIVPTADPCRTAAMSLLQRGQRGDPQARGEIEAISASDAGRGILSEARECLARGQRDKGRGVVIGAVNYRGQWSNAVNYAAGDFVLWTSPAGGSAYWKAVRDVSSPWFPSIQSGEVPGVSDAWAFSAPLTGANAQGPVGLRWS